MKIITPLSPKNIMVKFNTGRYEGRVQTSLAFSTRYADALRSALDAISRGCTQVEVIQYRDVVHNHSQLTEALFHLGVNLLDASDDEIIEEAHYATRPPTDVNLLSILNNYIPPWAQSGSKGKAA